MAEILTTIWSILFGCTVPILNITFREWIIGIFILGFLIDYIRGHIRKHEGVI